MTEFQPTERTRLKRAPDRASFDRETVYSILDEAVMCHLSYIADGSPHVIPTLHWRDGDKLYIHGSAASRTIRAVSGGSEVCVAVSHLDGLVLARSAFHHSVDYRSVVIYGRPEVVPDSRKEAVLRVLVEHLTPGRWDELRPVNAQEMKATTVLEMPIVEASAKLRSGPPVDEAEDMEWPVWAGNVPFEVVRHAPVPDPDLAAGIALPDYLVIG
jgi:uncharacterized protein